MSAMTAAQTPDGATPILDRQAPLPPPALRGSVPLFVIWIAIAIGFAASIAFLNSPALQEWLDGKARQWFPSEWIGARIFRVGASLLGIVVATIAIHELGHVVGGLCTGLSFAELRIGPLHFQRPFRISWYSGVGAATGGWAVMAPAKKDHLRLRALALVAGGPAANLLAGGIAFLLPPFDQFFSDIFILVSLGAGLGELLPFRTEVAVSDGIRLWMLLRNRASGERWLATMVLGNELRSGVLPEALSADYLAKAVAVRDGSVDTVTAHAIAYSAAFHLHKDAEAGQLLETCLKYVSAAGASLRAALMSDAAVFQARRRKRLDLAEEWLSSMPPSPPWLQRRAEAAILEAHGNREGALHKLKEVEAAILSMPKGAQREMLLRLLQRWVLELGGR